MDQQIGALLVQTLDPNGDIRKNAEKQLHMMEKQPGFSMLLLRILESPFDQGLKTSAALYFKNIIRKYWDEEESPVINPNDRDQIKLHLLTLMCSVPPVVQRQLSEAIRIIGQHDFPEKWPNLLPELRDKLGSTQDFTLVLGLLETANTLFKIFRDAEATDALWTKLKYCLDTFAEPLLKVFKSCSTMVQQNANNKPLLEQLFAALRLLARIFFSLCWQELPEYFEDHIEEWMDEFHTLLVYENRILVDMDEDEKPGPIELLQTAILENIRLYFSKYEEEFKSYVQMFAMDTWKLLNRLPRDIRYDDLAVISIKFLAALVGNVRQQSLFSNEASLKDICEKIVIPNLRLRESDYETFEDNPIEYIRRDIEGSDSDTRRRTACDLIRQMCRNFEAPTTNICSIIMNTLLASYAANTRANWFDMDTAITLMIALAVKGQTAKDGVTEVNDKVQVNAFYEKFIHPILTNPDMASPVVTADVIKFFTTFRNQMPREIVIPLLPHLVNLLKAKSFVVHTYAAQSIERVFMIKDGSVFRYTSQDIDLVLEPLMINLIQILESFEGHVENEYVVKTFMRTLTKANPEKIVSVTGPILAKLKVILGRVCTNPQNPVFIHFLFESIAALIRSGCSASPMMVEQFENQLMPPFQEVLAHDITELTPYVFQILAQMLELRPGGASPGYISLFQPLLRPEVWENAGNAPALVRLLEAYMRCAAMQTVGSDPKKLEGLLGVFQKLLSAKSTSDIAMRLLVGIVDFISPELYGPFLGAIIQMVLTRVQQLKSKQFGISVIHFLSVLIGKHGPKPVIDAMNSIAPGLLFQVIRELWIPFGNSFHSSTDRKASVIAITRLLAESRDLMEQSQLWEDLFIAACHAFEVTISNSDMISPEDQLAQMTETGYASSYAKLAYAQTELRDSFKEVKCAKEFLARSLFTSNQQTGGKVLALIKRALERKPNYTATFGEFCQAAGVHF